MGKDESHLAFKITGSCREQPYGITVEAEKRLLAIIERAKNNWKKIKGGFMKYGIAFMRIKLPIKEAFKKAGDSVTMD
jgi:hypothetical protein